MSGGFYLAFLAFAITHTVVQRRFARLGKSLSAWGPFGVPERFRAALSAARDVPVIFSPLVVASAVWIVGEWLLLVWIFSLVRFKFK